MELSTIIGLLIGILCIGVSMVMQGSPAAFFDLPSLFIVLGGTIASTIASYRGKSLKMLITIYRQAFFKMEIDLQKDIEMIIDIANVARREGLLALEELVQEVDSPFLKKGIALIVDGTDTELIRSILEAEEHFVQERHSEGQAMVLSMAAYAPAYGMIGTLIGLIVMLKNLSDVNALGPGMATALVTTFYGVILANLVFTPIAKKLKARSDLEAIQMELYIEGLLSIQEGENPRIIRDKLNAFIAPSELAQTPGTNEVSDANMRNTSGER